MSDPIEPDLDAEATTPIPRVVPAELSSIPVAVPDPTRPDVPKVVVSPVVEQHLASLALDASWTRHPTPPPSRWPARTTPPPDDHGGVPSRGPRARTQPGDALDDTTTFAL